MISDSNKTQTRIGVGSLTQLSAVGPQDLHIHSGTDTEAPEAFSFQSKYSQHTHFGKGCSNVYDLKSCTFGSRLDFEIPFEKQHLISNIILKIDMPDVFASDREDINDLEYTSIHYRDKIAYRLIKSVKFKINSEIIEEYTGQYMYILHVLETNSGHQEALEQMTGMNDCEALDDGHARSLYIPLHLWYSRTMKQFFPLLSLHKQKVHIEIQFESLENLVVCDNSGNVVNVNMTVLNNGKVKFTCNEADNTHEISNVDKHIHGEFYIDYIALNDIEQKNFIKNEVSHVYNLVLMQDEIIKSDNAKIDLEFNLPIKQLIFVLTDNNDEFYFSSFSDARLLFGEVGNQSMKSRDGDYYSKIQNHFHNLCNPSNIKIYSYSFALNASLTEHNGAVHFGKLPNKILEINGALQSLRLQKQDPSLSRVRIYIYARAYNIFYTSQGYGKVEFKA